MDDMTAPQSEAKASRSLIDDKNRVKCHDWQLMTDSSWLTAHDWQLVIDRACVSVGPRYRGSIPPLTAAQSPNVQDGGVRIRDILASFLESGRKWRRVVCVYFH